ncbi:hypothetical protein C8J57DRAFT_1233655 [Mycena rebaudengoi]|nr:hypothetical protein C8J57DRAFT_1233655 [Mycena rebaudengoi]
MTITRAHQEAAIALGITRSVEGHKACNTRQTTKTTRCGEPPKAGQEHEAGQAGNSLKPVKARYGEPRTCRASPTEGANKNKKLKEKKANKPPRQRRRGAEASPTPCPSGTWAVRRANRGGGLKNNNRRGTRGEGKAPQGKGRKGTTAAAATAAHRYWHISHTKADADAATKDDPHESESNVPSAEIAARQHHHGDTGNEGGAGVRHDERATQFVKNTKTPCLACAKDSECLIREGIAKMAPDQGVGASRRRLGELIGSSRAGRYGAQDDAWQTPETVDKNGARPALVEVSTSSTSLRTRRAHWHRQAQLLCSTTAAAPPTTLPHQSITGRRAAEPPTQLPA